MGSKAPAVVAGRGLLGGAARLLRDNREQGFSHLGEPAPSWASGLSHHHQAIMGTVPMGTVGVRGESSRGLAWVPATLGALVKGFDCAC